MGFKIDYSQASNMGNVADGTYEAVFYMVTENVNEHTGSDFIRFDLIIRNDVEQKFQNSHLFDQMYKSKETGKYSMKRLAWLASAAQLDQSKEYNSMEELCEDFVAHPVRVTVRNSDREYKGRKYHDVNISRWEKTQFPKLNHQWKDTPEKLMSNATSPADVSSEDDKEMPF